MKLLISHEEFFWHIQVAYTFYWAIVEHYEM